MPKKVGENDVKIAGRIKIARKEAGYSQADLAKALKISIQQVQKYESGKNRISAGNLCILARFLGKGLYSFFDKTQINCGRRAKHIIIRKSTE